MTSEGDTQFWEEVASSEEQIGADPFCPDLERHRQRWQRRKDKILAQYLHGQRYAVGMAN